MRNLNTIWRLRLIYLLLGMMLFYGVEQLFLNKYLHDASARGIVTVVYTISLVLFDVPAGIVADRVGRKACMLASCLVQMASLVVLGASSSLAMYLVGCVLFGLQMCLFNGAAQAYLYDWLAAHSRAESYGKLQGNMYAWWLSGAAAANILSGFIAHGLGLRSVYFLSIVPGSIALFLLAKLGEPPIEKKQAMVWYAHAQEAFHEIRTHGNIINFSLQFMATGIILLTIGEFGQIYILSFGVSTVLLGIYWAFAAAFAAGGRATAHILQRRPRLAIVIFCIVLAVFSMVHSTVGIGLFWILYGLNEALANVAETEIQDYTSSHIRATMFSMVSFLGNIVAVPVVLMYTNYYRHHGIYAANRVVIIGVIVVLLLTLAAKPNRRKQSKPADFISQPRGELIV